MRTLLLAFLLLIPSLSFAAYQNPTVATRDPLPDGFVRVAFIFAGNAGEPSVRRIYTITPATTATILRNWVDETIQELDRLYTASIIPSLQPGQTVPRLAKVDPVPTAKQVWNKKLQHYLMIKDAGITAATSELNSLKADLESTYQVGFLAE